MFKTFTTLCRGAAAANAEDFADQNALLILDQQMRDAQAGLGRAQRALAVALAEAAQEARRGAALAERIAGLEARARAALAGGEGALAMAAAETIAELANERDAGERAVALFAAEIGRLRRQVGDAERRLAELQRGRRVARVAEAVRRSRQGGVLAGPAADRLSEAEATLARLRERQEQAMTADAALDALSGASQAPSVEDRLADAGFGPATRVTAAAVFARLQQS
jgi:phage shock protein A